MHVIAITNQAVRNYNAQMLIHTITLYSPGNLQLPNNINVRTTIAPLDKRKAGKRPRARYLVPYNRDLTPQQNHVAAMQQYCAQYGIVSWWALTQETQHMYRFTEIDASNTLQTGAQVQVSAD